MYEDMYILHALFVLILMYTYNTHAHTRTYVCITTHTRVYTRTYMNSQVCTLLVLVVCVRQRINVCIQGGEDS